MIIPCLSFFDDKLSYRFLSVHWKDNTALQDKPAIMSELTKPKLIGFDLGMQLIIYFCIMSEWTVPKLIGADLDKHVAIYQCISV